MFRAPRHRSIVVTALLTLLIFARVAYSQNIPTGQNFGLVRTEFKPPDETKSCSADHFSTLSTNCDEDHGRVSTELAALGRRGDLIQHARDQVLQILQDENSCSAWFREADANPAAVFRSLHFKLDESGGSNIYSMRNDRGALLLKHPWGARSIENAGHDAVVWINAHGPFFFRESRVKTFGAPWGLPASGNWHLVYVGLFPGNTPAARIAIMLHELGHTVGRIPEDGDSWDGLSSRNTAEVLRHCKREIQMATRKNLTSAID